METPTATPDTGALPPPSSFADLTSALARPMTLVIELNGELKTIALRRISAAERALVDDLYQEVENRSNQVLPPMKRDRGTDGDVRPDEQEPRYRQALAGFRRQARAMAVFIAWPEGKAAASAAGEGAENPKRLAEWMERALPESLMEAVYLRTLSDGVGIALGDRVSFTSAGG